MSDQFDVHTAHRECILEEAKKRKAAGEVSDYEKICVRIPEEAGWETEAEWLWGCPVSEQIFEIRNIPLYAKGLALGDHVRTKFANEAFEYVEVVKAGGHSTYRIIARDGIDSPKVKQIIDTLLKMGCDWERGNRIHAAFDVPPMTDVYAVYEILQKAEDDGMWEFEEGVCGHPLKK